MLPCNTCTRPSYCKYRERCTRNFPFAKTEEGVFLAESVERNGFEKATDEVRKATPIDAIFKFWPDAMVELAQHIWEGNKKYNPEHPKIGWKRELSSDHVGSLIRHVCYDYVKATTKEAKIKVMRAVAWRALAELQLLTEEEADG